MQSLLADYSVNHLSSIALAYSVICGNNSKVLPYSSEWSNKSSFKMRSFKYPSGTSAAYKGLLDLCFLEQTGQYSTLYPSPCPSIHESHLECGLHFIPINHSALFPPNENRFVKF